MPNNKNARPFDNNIGPFSTSATPTTFYNFLLEGFRASLAIVYFGNISAENPEDNGADPKQTHILYQNICALLSSLSKGFQGIYISAKKYRIIGNVRTISSLSWFSLEISTLTGPLFGYGE